MPFMSDFMDILAKYGRLPITSPEECLAMAQKNKQLEMENKALKAYIDKS